MSEYQRRQANLYKGDEADKEARFNHAAASQRRYSRDELFYDYDPFAGFIERYSYSHNDEAVYWSRTQLVQPFLDDNAEWRAAEQNWRKKDDKWIRFAHIPNSVVELWMQEGIDVYQAKTDRNGVPNEHMKAVLKRLRDPDWKFLKTTELDMGDGNQTGNTRLTHVPGNGLIWPSKDDL